MNRFSRVLILPLIMFASLARPEIAFSERNSTSFITKDDSVTEVKEISLPNDTLPSSSDTLTGKKDFFEAATDSSWWTRSIPNRAFGLGERLEFSVRYGAISAGNAVMEIFDTTVVDNQLCYRIASTANSNDFVSIFYKVRDSVQTFLDVPGLFPRLFSKQLREGSYRVDRRTLFDQKNHLAITGKDSIPTFGFVQDPLSSLYYLRTQELVPGKDIMIDSHTDRKNYPITIKVLGKDRIKVPAGKFDCIVIEPVMRSEGIFKAKGNIKIWLTDDEYKMPVMMKTEVYFLGSINAQLNKYTRGRILDGQIQKD